MGVVLPKSRSISASIFQSSKFLDFDAISFMDTNIFTYGLIGNGGEHIFVITAFPVPEVSTSDLYYSIGMKMTCQVSTTQVQPNMRSIVFYMI